MSRLSMTAVPTMDHIQAVDARKAPTRVAAPFDGRSWLGMDMGTPSCSSSASSSSLSASDSSPSSTSLSSVASFNVVPASKVRKRPSLADDISLKLIFMALGSSEDTLPPAFFPASRISFAPRLRIRARHGFPYSALGGMQLGVTGMYEMLDGAGKVTSKRMVADFCTDLSSGLEIWKRDADAARQTQEVRSSDMLPSGTYLLPLSLKLPQSDRLPPSFECQHFRIHYTMSIVIFSSITSSTGKPRRLKSFSIPFDVLPSTLPTLPPTLPILTHETRSSDMGTFASFARSLSLSPSRGSRGQTVVIPSLPTSSFSPASQASIPISLRIIDRPLEPTDLYVRLSLLRKTYSRRSTTNSLAAAIDEAWGVGAASTMAIGGFLDASIAMKEWCTSEEEVISRWGWIPYSSRPGADPTETAEVIIHDIGLPLSGIEGEGWRHGYSTSLDIEPTPVPSLAHGESSWFSPAFRHRPPVAGEYEEHVHVSTRFFLNVEVGFSRRPDFEVALSSLGIPPPPALSFTSPRGPSSTPGPSSTNPFPNNPFPGKLRSLLIPVTIGSVAEPSMECIVAAGISTGRQIEMDDRLEVETEERDPAMEGTWLCAPPGYEEPPSYFESSV